MRVREGVQNMYSCMNKFVTEDTIRSLRAGDHQAFETVFFAYFNKVKYFIYGLIKSESDAEELAQDIFVRIWTNRDAIDPKKNFTTYIYVSARNAALNFLKKRLVRSSYTQEQLHIGNETDNPEEGFFAREIDLLIQMSVSKMPDRRKRIYEMSRNEGLTNDEIALRMNISKKTVENQLSLALKELREVVSLIALFFFGL